MLKPTSLVLAVAPLLLAPALARADVGPVDDSCTVEKRCKDRGVECRYVNSQPDAGDLACVDDAKKRGLEKACARGGGTVGYDVYCPKGEGQKPSGCAVAAAELGAPAGLAYAAMGLVIAAAAARRKRR